MNSLSRPMYHRNFYPGDCRQQIAAFLSTYLSPEPGSQALVAAVVPHAGWHYSGAVAARTLKTLSDRSTPRSVIIFGAVHRAWLPSGAVYPEGEWQTPLGSVPVDAALAAEVLSQMPGLLESDPEAHQAEHSIEVQVPFIHELFPGVPILPIMVPPEGSPTTVGSRMAKIVSGRNVLAMASTDLTHYGDAYGFAPAGFGEKAHTWMRQNNRRILDIAVRLGAEQIIHEARVSQNACGAGALAAVVAFARESGSRGGIIVEETDSHEVAGKGGPFYMGVGYAGVVF